MEYILKNNKLKITNKKRGEKIKKWILWMVVVSIMISMMTGCNNSSSNLSGYSPATGVLDTTFDGDGIVINDNAAGGYGRDEGESIYVDSSGKIYVTGYSRNSSGNDDMVIWRYNSNGSLDTSFGNNGIVVHHNAAGGNSDDVGRSIYVDNTGKIYVTGYSRNSSDNKDMVIWRYNSDGRLDTSFNGTGIVVHHNASGGNSYDEGNSIYVDSSGKIYVTGYSYNFINAAMVIWKYK
jgi:uncharacterized delta-60 repeat protein